MKKNLILSAIVFLMASGIFAGNTSGNENDLIKKTISKNIAFPNKIKNISNYEKAKVIFKITTEGAVEVLRVDHANLSLNEHIIKELEGIKINNPSLQTETIYSVEIIFKKL